MAEGILSCFQIPDAARAARPEAVVEAFLKEKILSGAYPEGTLLPSTLPWARALRINDRRLQRALSRLTAEGFLERRPRYGTRVKRRTARPVVVILCSFALVEEPLYFLRKIIEHLRSQLRALDYEVEVIDDLFSLLVNDFDQQQQRVERLRERLTALDPAGYVECVFDLSRLPDLYPALKRPLVSFYPTTSGGDVAIDERASVHESMKYLAAQGRRKVLLLRSAGRLSSLHRATETFWNDVEAFGFLRGTFREIYHSGLNDSMEEEAYRWTLQLVKSWKGLRRNYVPDCLLVCDDIMMRGVARALAQTPVRVPEELLIVSSANESIRFPYAVPVVRCETPLSEVAQRLTELLDARIRRRKPPRTPVHITSARIVPPA
ncbi:MAG TPA: substrate-binding domain-containing protein [Chthoniobacteraceae bacterium]|nr:substrate-binding domain-containing protein [Chthoniobacteraceae bacterium]